MWLHIFVMKIHNVVLNIKILSTSVVKNFNSRLVGFFFIKLIIANTAKMNDLITLF